MGRDAESEGDAEITLEDVLLAVKVIKKFMTAQTEIQRLLRQMAPTRYEDPRMELVREMLLAQRGARTSEEEEDVEDELTPEELERLKKVAKSIK
jgi:hypothetical protein